MIVSLASAAVAPSTRFAFAARAGGEVVAQEGRSTQQPDEAAASGAPDSASAAAGTAGTSPDPSSPVASSVKPLTSREQRLLEQLRQTDRQVRAHEQAHMAAGAGLVRGGASFSYATGPDNKRYAVGGEVSIDVSRPSTPQETLVKARQIRAAALAPADPSAQDLKVAAQAASMENEAHAEIAAQQRAAITAGAGLKMYGAVERGAPAGRLNVYA